MKLIVQSCTYIFDKCMNTTSIHIISIDEQSELESCQKIKSILCTFDYELCNYISILPLYENTRF